MMVSGGQADTIRFPNSLLAPKKRPQHHFDDQLDAFWPRRRDFSDRGYNLAGKEAVTNEATQG
jgi:hypothetical protein